MTSLFPVSDEILDVCGVVAACAASVALPGYPAVRRGLSGTLLVAFAMASYRIAGGGETVEAARSVTSLAITGGIALLGLFILVFQAAQALSRGPRDLRRSWVMLTTALAFGLTARFLIPLVDIGGFLITLATVAALFLLGALILAVGSRAPPRPGRSPQEWLPIRADLPLPGSGLSTRWAVVSLWIHIWATVALLLVSHLQLFLIAFFLAFASGLGVERALGRPGIPPATLAAIPVLGLVWYLLVHVGGEPWLKISALHDAPYSPAFQFVTSLALALVAWALLRLWPLHSAPRGPLAPLLGGLLFVRLLSPALPEGVLHWQPMLYLLAAIAAGHAALTQRDDEALAVLAVLGLASGVPAAGGAGLGFALASIVARLVQQLKAAGRVLNGRGRAAVTALALACSTLLLPVLRAALVTQVFYSAVTVAALALALWACGSPGSRRA
jgi:hypothetical protein